MMSLGNNPFTEEGDGIHGPVSLLRHFQDLPDLRVERTKRHNKFNKA